MASQPVFDFKEQDQEGLETLDVISAAGKLNRWMFETIRPYSSGRVLEIGSGIGNISAFFLHEGYDITLTDIRENYCSILRQKFSSEKSLREVLHLDLVAPDFESRYKHILNSFNTVFALNVVEHIQDDELAIKNAHKLLVPGGILIILVPAFSMLYNRLDHELFHYRRYVKRDLNLLFQKQNLTILKSFYFNAAGIAGWFVSGKIQRNKTLPQNQVRLYDWFVPFFRILDKLLLNRVGLSVITIGRK